LPADSREEALVLGIAGLHAGAWLQGQGRSEMELQKGRHLAEFLPHAEAMFDALPSLPPLDPAVWEGREALLASCLAYYRASAASLRQDWPRARELLESLVSGPPGPWTERGEEALEAIGQAYGLLLSTDPTMLQAQLQTYAAALDDADVRQAVREGYGDLYTYAERVSGVSQRRLARFFANGMLLNVIAAMGFHEEAEPEPWAARLMTGCRETDED